MDDDRYFKNTKSLVLSMRHMWYDGGKVYNCDDDLTSIRDPDKRTKRGVAF